MVALKRTLVDREERLASLQEEVCLQRSQISSLRRSLRYVTPSSTGVLPGGRVGGRAGGRGVQGGVVVGGGWGWVGVGEFLRVKLGTWQGRDFHVC